MEAGKPWEGSWEDLNLEDLYKSPWFFGKISEEKAKKILVEALQNDGNSKEKSILFLKTVLYSASQPRLNGKKHFTVVNGQLWQHDLNGRPQFIFHEDIWFIAVKAVNNDPFENSVMRKNPFSLELANVKFATSGVNVETLVLPKKIKDELKKYHAFNDSFISEIMSFVEDDIRFLLDYLKKQCRIGLLLHA
jgi:hypothetical protein